MWGMGRREGKLKENKKMKASMKKEEKIRIDNLINIGFYFNYSNFS